MMDPHQQPLIGIDLGGTKTLMVIANREGKLFYKKQWPSLTDLPPLVKKVRETLQEAAVSEAEIMAMGIGVAGITDCDRGVVIEAPALHWKNFHLSDQIRRFFDFPVFVDNDVNCAAFGEQWLGAARETGDFLFIAIGTGVGGAIIANGNIIRGGNFMAGEIGYWLEKSDIGRGRQNRFGEFGLFEQKVSGTALKKRLPSSREEWILDLSVTIANAVNLLNPKKVILGGGVSASLGSVIDLIRETVARLTPVPTRIEITHLGDEAAALGAVAYAMQRTSCL